jgi:hypothetical protein
MVIDIDGTKWFATDDGVAHLDGTTWVIYNPSNCLLPDNVVSSVEIFSDGSKWFGTDGGVLTRFDGSTWTAYNSDNGLPDGDVIALEPEGERGLWIGTNDGAGFLWLGPEYPVTDNAQWLSDSRWQATYDVTSLVPRGAYTITVSGVQGLDGMQIPADTRFDFAVDYAGEISDQTPPPPPFVMAGGVEGDASTVVAWWNAEDPESSITGYRYTIGSSAGATDIVNWTPTSNNSVTRSDLGLVLDRQYWLAVQARNEGGLWSLSGDSAFVAGRPLNRMFLPLVIKSR